MTSMPEAQRRKHEYVAERIGIGPGCRLLDLGCGWGPLLGFVLERLPEDYRAGHQDDVYRDVFARAASVLLNGGRLYLQTMVFGAR
jgi:Mycolic acid cyclopropane synthetase